MEQQRTKQQNPIQTKKQELPFSHAQAVHTREDAAQSSSVQLLTDCHTNEFADLMSDPLLSAHLAASGTAATQVRMLLKAYVLN